MQFWFDFILLFNIIINPKKTKKKLLNQVFKKNSFDRKPLRAIVFVEEINFLA